jgi:Lipocalin-like domain
MPTRNTNNSPAQTPYTAAELDERTKYRYLAYAGRYSVSDAGVIDHLPDVSLFPNWEHTVVPRRATIANDRLTLELVEPLVIDGRQRGGRLTWERVEVFEARTKPLGATGSSELHTAATEGER